MVQILTGLLYKPQNSSTHLLNVSYVLWIILAIFSSTCPVLCTCTAVWQPSAHLYTTPSAPYKKECLTILQTLKLSCQKNSYTTYIVLMKAGHKLHYDNISYFVRYRQSATIFIWIMHYIWYSVRYRLSATMFIWIMHYVQYCLRYRLFPTIFIWKMYEVNVTGL